MADLEDDLELYEEPIQNEDQGKELTHSTEISKEETDWKALSLENQCDDVLDILSRGKRRWERGVGSPDIPPLEEYKKRTLAFAQGTGDIMNNTRFTALHWLARSGKDSKFDRAPPHVCIELMGYLLENENRIHDMNATRYQEGREERLVLEYALFSGNNKFIDCVDECLGDKSHQKKTRDTSVSWRSWLSNPNRKQLQLLAMKATHRSVTPCTSSSI